MGGSIYLFKLAGIDLRMHITFPLILLWGALRFGLLTGQGLTGGVFGVVVTLLLFAIVVLHELGHALTARRFGVPTRQIVLLPIGGVAQLERIPSNPVQELLIALAGPAVNFVLAGLLFVLGRAFNIGLSDLWSGVAALTQGTGAPLFGTVLFGYVFVTNLFIAIFNLIPAFPLDGGRVLRALLATAMPYTRATQIAAIIGQGLALLLGLWGFLGGGFFIILVAIFIYMGAGAEVQLVQARSTLRDVRVGQAFSRQVHVLSPNDPLQRAVDLTLGSFQADFPVVQDGRLVGLLTGADLLKALSGQSGGALVGSVMRSDFGIASPTDDLFETQQKFAEQQIDALPVVDGGRFVGLLTSRDLNEVYRLMSVNPDLLRARAPQHRA